VDIKVRVISGVVVLDLSGSIDVNSANLVEVVGQCIRDGYMDVLCNFEEVESIDYMGISVLAIAYKEIINAEGRMKILNIPMHLRNLLSITGMDKSLEIYNNEDLAISSFKEDKIIETIKKKQLRRRFKRLPIDIKVELKAKNPRTPGCYNVDILNLSGIGAYIFGCDKFTLGDEVILKFKMPPQMEDMQLEAKVVWISDKQIQLPLSPGIGVAFHNIDTQTQEKLVEFIERNLSLMIEEDK